MVSIKALQAITSICLQLIANEVENGTTIVPH